MELKKLLTEFDELDAEFVKNESFIIDVVVSHLNKRIDVLNTLRDELYEWFVKTYSLNKKWSISKEVHVLNSSFPKKKGTSLTKFGEEIFFTASIHFNLDKKSRIGFLFEYNFHKGNLFLSAGQWNVYAKMDTIFPFSFYKDVKRTVDRKEKYISTIYYPGHENEEGDGKWIDVGIPVFEMTDLDRVVDFQKTCKNMIVVPAIEYLRKTKIL